MAVKKKKTTATPQGDLVGVSLRRGWEVTKKNLGMLVGVFVVTLIVGNFDSIAESMFGKQENLFGLLLWLIGVVLSSAVSLGMMAMILKMLDNKKVEFMELFGQFGKVVTYLLATILVSIVTIIGFICLIVPGIYVAIRLGLYPYLILEKNMGVTESIQKSWELTSGRVFELFLLGLVLVLVNILGLAALFVGLLITVPLSMVAGAQAYRMIMAKK